MQLLVPLLIFLVTRAYGHGYLTRAVPRSSTGAYTFPSDKAGQSRLSPNLNYAWGHHDPNGLPINGPQENFDSKCNAADKKLKPGDRKCYWRGDPTACVLGDCAAPIDQRVNNNDLFVCRGPNKNPDLLEVAAGSSLDFRYHLAANHPGDCDVFISYDVDKPMQQKEFFKIANIPECENREKFKMSQAECDNDNMVSGDKCKHMFHAAITLPAWLPAGEVILRFGWVAVHPFPNIEYYADCVDAKILPGTSPIALPAITKYLLKNAFPAISCDHRGTQENGWQEQPCERGKRSKFVYRCNWNPTTRECVTDPETFMLGPECANQYTGNDCVATARGTPGNTKQDATDPTGNPTDPPTQAPDPATQAPDPATQAPDPATQAPDPVTQAPDPPTQAPETAAPTQGPTPTQKPGGIPESFFCALVSNLKIGFLRRLAKKASTDDIVWTGEEVCAIIAMYCKNPVCLPPTAAPLEFSEEKEKLQEELFFNIGAYTLEETGPQGNYSSDSTSTSGSVSISTSISDSTSTSTADGGAIGAINSAPKVGFFGSLALLVIIHLLL